MNCSPLIYRFFHEGGGAELAPGNGAETDSGVLQTNKPVENAAMPQRTYNATLKLWKKMAFHLLQIEPTNAHSFINVKT
jgi:hypothetical protein